MICLFGIGLALGCDYPTAHMIISESIPSRSRGKLVLGAFGFQALGALAGTGIGYLVLSLDPTLGAWRWMYATAIIPAVLVTAGRFFITESPGWLHARGAFDQAEREALRLLHRQPQYPTELRLSREAGAAGQVPTAACRALRRCSMGATAARPSSPQFPGSSRIWALTVSAFSRRRYWQPR